MSEVNWGIGMPQGNPGDYFMQAYRQGRQERDQRTEREAMARLVANPEDEEALKALAGINPQGAMNYQNQRREQGIKAVEQHRDAIMAGAKIFRQLQVKDEPSYQQALQVARQYGLPLDGVPPTYNPEYVNGVMSLADAFEPQKEGPSPTVIDGVAFDPRTGKPMFESPYNRIISGPGGIYEQPRIGIGRQPGAPTAPQGRTISGALPEGWRFEDEGGPTPSASGGFLP